MPGKLDAYNLGERGVNLVKSPLHKADGDLVLAQNAQIIPYHAQRAISKRRGMTKINATTAAAGYIFNLIRVSFTDPNASDIDPTPSTDPDFPPPGTSATWIYTSYGDFVSVGGPYKWLYSSDGSSFGKENVSPALNFWVDAHNAIYDPIDGTGNFYCFCVGGGGIRLYELNGGVSTNYIFEAAIADYCQWIDKDGSTWYFGASSANTGYVGKYDGSLTDLSWPGTGVGFGHWFNGILYVGEYGTTANATAARVWKYDGSWSAIHTFARTTTPSDSKPVVYSGCVWDGKMWFTLGSGIGGSFGSYDVESKVVSMDTSETFTVSNPATTGVFRAPIPFDNKLFVFRGSEGSGGGAPFTGCEAWSTTDGTNWVLDKDLTTVKTGANRVESAREWQGDLYCIVRSSTLHNLLKRDTSGTWSIVIDSAFSLGQYLREGLARSDG